MATVANLCILLGGIGIGAAGVLVWAAFAASVRQPSEGTVDDVQPKA